MKVDSGSPPAPESWLSMQAKLDLWRAAGKPAQVVVFEGVGAV